MPGPTPALTLWKLLDDAARTVPERVLVSDASGRRLTCAALRRLAEQVAAGLDVGPDDVVTWQLPTVLDAVVLMAALARVGATQTPVIPILREAEVRHIVEQSGTTVLVVPTTWRGFDHAAMAHDLAAGGPVRVITVELAGSAGGEATCLPVGDPAGLPAPPGTDDAVRWLYYTSGTTAAPKGVRHTDASVIASSAGILDGLGIRDGDVYPIAWPFTHIGGIAMLVSVLRAGGELVLFDSFDPATFGDVAAAVSPTLLGTGVPFFRSILDAQRRHGAAPLYPRLRAFTAGGGPTPPEVSRELIAVFGVRGVANSWGLTEFPIATAPSPDDVPEKLLTTVGRPAPGVHVRVVDGELRLKGPQCFAGYVDSSLDADAFDEDGWLRTGDLGTVDDDGYVSITGRLKDVIIRNAENISSLEVEDVLRRHPAIADATVIGVPDPATGERVCAVVATRPGTTLTLEDVRQHFTDQGVARQKTPERLEIVDAIPRNPMGKVLKQLLLAEIR